MTKKGVETIATVVKIHRDDPEELYVTVRDASGQERQALCGNQISGAPRHRRDVVPVTRLDGVEAQDKLTHWLISTQ